MTTTHPIDPAGRLRAALATSDASARLQVALAAGTRPDPSYVEALVERCGIEDDFFVRDMLTWALTRHPASLTVPRLLDEARSGRPRARSQALHTLSKIGDPAGWAAVPPAVLADPDDEVARSAWRAAVALVPDGGEAALASVLATQLARGDHEVRRSLSRALAALGDAVLPVLAARRDDPDEEVRAHAAATERLLADPDADFDAALAEARRVAALTGAPRPPDEDADR